MAPGVLIDTIKREFEAFFIFTNTPLIFAERKTQRTRWFCRCNSGCSFNMKQYTEEAKRFYKSKKWEKVRTLYAQNKDGLCERCLADGIYTAGKIVHHKIYLNDAGLKDPAIALSFDNLELLCQECHNKEHHKTEPKRRYSFDEFGNVKENES